MNDSIVLIRKAATFMVTAIKNNLEKNKYDVYEADLEVNSINAVKDNSDLFVYYLDDSVSEANEALVYIRDMCSQENKKIILIGTPLEFEVSDKYISGSMLVDKIERPLDMDSFISKVNIYMNASKSGANIKTILIVDDDPTYLRVLHEWLSKDYKVAMANSGMQAITWIASHKADLVLLDYEMPITSGPKVLEMIRSEANSSGMPVMFLTGKSDKQSIIKVLSLKPDGYLLKTIDRNTLLETLNKFFWSKDYKQ